MINIKENKLIIFFIQYIPFLVFLCTLLFWNSSVSGFFDLKISFAILLIAVFVTLIGHAFIEFILKGAYYSNLPSKLAIGCLLSNCLLLLVAFISPFNITVNSIFIGVLVIFLLWLKDKSPLYQVFLVKNTSELLLIIFACFIATIWCRDALLPIQFNDEFISLKMWGDVFYHMSQINVFARAQGVMHEADILSSAIPFRLYHYGNYQLPALITAIGNLSSYEAFASFLLPLGLLILIFAAYLFASSLFGVWPGFFAALFLMLLPDPFQQGFGNLFLGQFYWLIQASPAMPYGVACAAMAFACLFKAVINNQFRLLLVGYGFVLITLLYKSQIFVAISFPALVFPVIFMGKMNFIRRVGLVLFLTLIYFGVIYLVSSPSSIPTIRLDGSGFIPYTSWLNEIQGPGYLKELINSKLVSQYRAAKIFAYIFLLVIASLGGLFFIYLFIFWFLNKRLNASITYFPFFIIGIYLVMSLGLALNESDVGLPEELLHRPFVWAYFVVTLWAIAGAYYIYVGDRIPNSPIVKWGLFSALGLFLIVPLKYSLNIQGHVGSSQIKIPSCEYKLAQFLRANTSRKMIFQEYKQDASMAITAFSQRQEFAVNFIGTKLPRPIRERLIELTIIKNSRDPIILKNYMEDNRISYLIVDPESDYGWIMRGLNKPIYECSGYKIFSADADIGKLE